MVQNDMGSFRVGTRKKLGGGALKKTTYKTTSKKKKKKKKKKKIHQSMHNFKKEATSR